MIKNRGLIRDLEMYGRNGDTTVGHLTPGEVVLPRSIAGDPSVQGVLKQKFTERGLNPGRYEIGGSDDSINPVTGVREFYDQSTDGQQSTAGSDPGNDSNSDSITGYESIDSFPSGHATVEDTLGGLSSSERSFLESLGINPDSVGSKEQAQQAAAAAQQAQVDSGLAGLYSALGINPNAPALDRDAYNLDAAKEEAAAKSLYDQVLDRFNLQLTVPNKDIGIAGYPSWAPGASVFKGAAVLGDVLSALFEQLGGVPGDNKGSDSDSLSNQLIRFANDPTYGNIPKADAARALAALQKALGGVDALVEERGFTGKDYEAGARSELQKLFDSLTGNSDIESVLNADVGRNLATSALSNKEIELRNQGLAAYNQAFPENYASTAFNPDAFNKSMESVLNQLYSSASQYGGTAAARGNLSTQGLQKFNIGLESQRPTAQSRLNEVGSSVTSGYQSKAKEIGDKAYSAASGYKLGDELFNPEPYKAEFDAYKASTEPKYTEDINSALGVERLFDPTGALQSAGMQQGMVSGQSPLLDAIANRQTGLERKRGLGVSGSGVF